MGIGISIVIAAVIGFAALERNLFERRSHVKHAQRNYEQTLQSVINVVNEHSQFIAASVAKNGPTQGDSRIVRPV